ncbi:calcium/sodium antiporter [Halorarius litoreus]|uniref:calcium/sodium antiporter n=1 Tax=Halorarius litoreus TaxID=2962676 RepID=UPI0020CDDED5|nr:calcium/sodium antiporter [Halorarius litoreus]
MQAVGVDLVFLLVSIGALWYGAESFVDGAVALARRFQLSEVVVGVVILGIGTSLPEVATSVDAAVAGRPNVAVGNAVGSNLFNLGLVLGVVALLGAIRAPRMVRRRDAPVMLGATGLTALALFDLHLSRVEGVVLLTGLAGYLLLLARSDGSMDPPPESEDRQLVAAGRVVLGLALVVAGADLLVSSASDLARLVGLSEWVIGETVVAVGTSSPELVAGIAAARRGTTAAAVGNVVGSSVFNLLGVLGLVAIVRPATVETAATGTVLWLVGLTVLVSVLLYTDERFTRGEGVVCMAVNATRWVLDLV